MDTLSIVLILVALLVIVLVGLNFGNKKLANHISVLEQTIETKDESIIYYMQTYEAAREAVMKDEEKERNLQKSYQEITELTAQKDELETKLQQMETKVFDIESAHKDVVEEVTEKIFMIEKDSAKKNHDFDVAQEEFLLRVDELEQDKKNLEKELELQKKEMRIHLDTLADLDKSKTLLEEALVESRDTHSLAMEATEQAHAKIIEDVTEKIFVLEKNMAIKDADISELEKKYEALRVQSNQKYEEYKTTLVSTQTKYENLEAEHNQFEEEKKQEIEVLRDNIETLKRRSKERSEKDAQNILSLENKLNQEVEKYAKLEQKYSHDISALEKKEEALNKLLEDNQQAFRTYKEKSIDTISSLEKTLDMKSESLKEITKKYENYQATSQAEIKTLTALHERQKQDNEALQIEYDASKKEKDEKIELLELKYKQFDEEQSVLRKEFESQIEEYRHKVQMKDDALETMRKEKDENNARLNESIVTLEASLSQSHETYTALKEETSTKVSALEERIKEGEVEIEKLQTQMEALEIEYQDEIRGLEEKMQSEREKHVHEQQEAREKLEVTRNEHKQEIAEVVANLETEKNRNTAIVEAFEKEREENLALKNNLEEALENLTIEKERLLGTIDEQDEKIMTLIQNHEVSMHKKQDQVSKLFEEIQKFSQIIKSNKTDYETLTILHENTQSELAVVKGLLQEKEQEKETLNATLEAYKLKSQETEERHLAYQEEQEMLLAQMEEEKNRQIDKLEEERKALDALRVEMQESEKKAADEKRAYEKKILEKNQKLDAAIKFSTLKENEIARLTTEKNKIELTLKEQIVQSDKMIENLKLELDHVLEQKEALDEQFSAMQEENQSKLSEMNRLLNEKEKAQETLSIAFESYKTKSQQREESNLKYKNKQAAQLFEMTKEKEAQERKLEEERKALAALRLEMNNMTKTIALKESEIKTLSDKVTEISDKAIEEVKALENEIKTLYVQKNTMEEQLQDEITQKNNLLKEQEKFANATLLHNEKVKQLESSISKFQERVENLKDENLQKNKALDEMFTELENLQKRHDKSLLESKEEMTALLEKHHKDKRNAEQKLNTLRMEIENKSVELAALQGMKEKGDGEIERLREMFQVQLDINEKNIIKFKEKLASKHKTIEKLKASQEQIDIPTIHSEVLDLLNKGVKKKKIAKKFDLSVVDIDFIIEVHKP